MSSSVTLFARSRWTLAMQSIAVSPPPTTTTSRPSAQIRSSGSGGGRAGRPGPDDGDRAPAARLRRARADPALLPGPLDDRQLDLLDRHGVVVDGQHAGRLARRRADAPRELREVVRGVQLGDRRAPLVAVDEIVPVRDQVAERAALVAERHAAVHAPRALLARRVLGQALVDLLEVGDARAGVALRRGRAGDAQETTELAHRSSGRVGNGAV